MNGRYQQQNKERIRERKMRYYAENQGAILDHKRRYYEENKEERRELRRRYREENPDRVREQKQRHYQNNKERILEWQRRYREENPDRVREVGRLSEKRWREKNQPIIRLSRERRRSAPFSEEAKDYARLILNDPCAYCGEVATSIDHIVAISAGGGSGVDNLAPACRSCNSGKRDRPLLQFLLSRERERSCG
jgi:5-methylcytosine-specific restriction endonuclease McrA